MKEILTGVFICIFLFSSAQKIKPVEIWIDLACGYEGRTASEVYLMKLLVKNKDHTELKACLTTTNNVQKSLGIVAINKMLLNETIVLAKAELANLENFIHERGYITVCNGCTELYRSTIKDFFRNPKSNGRHKVEEYIEVR